MPISEPHHIISIGASAGGIEEIISFFDHTPLDGVAYVIVQHLSQDFKSRMVELLSRHSKLKITEAKNNLLIKANHVYIIPNDKFMTISSNKLMLTDKENVQGPHLTINTFFNSLAEECGNKAIAVVLSGLGSDGSEGVKTIKKAGGMIIARNPETTQFGSMPAAAIATGSVDFILEPESMPATIEEYVTSDRKLQSDNKNDQANLKAILQLISEKSPLDFSEYRDSTILRRIKRRAAYNNFTNLENYVEYLKSSEDEVDLLTKDFLISVTCFFRDKEAFDFIEKEIMPKIISKPDQGEELKIWVTGCATGEEAYSMAILISEQLEVNNKYINVKIFATDIDNAALEIAGKGIYDESIGRDVSNERLQKFFTKEGEYYQIKPEIRRMVIFAHHDLVKNPPYCNMQLISCRNLLIYMTPTLQKKIFQMLFFGLKKDGYLFLGSSENPLPGIQDIETVNKKWKIYRNLQTKRQIRFESFSLPVFTDKKMISPYVNKENNSENPQDSLTEAVNSSLTQEINGLVVCVDESNHVIKTYGKTDRFLLQKILNTSFIELLPRPLAVAFNTLSNKVKKTNMRSSVHDVKILENEKVILVNISVYPATIKKSGQRVLIVTIQEETPVKDVNYKKITFDEKIFLDEYLLNIENENQELKESLHSMYLQLEASNENMLSFNEEVLSANEELQSTNEEMQSVNDELNHSRKNLQDLNNELEERVNSRTNELANSEKRFRNMLDTIPQLTWTFTSDLNATFYNKRWYDYTGADLNKAIGTSWKNFVYEEDLKPTLAFYEKLSIAQTGIEIENRYKRSDNQFRWHLNRLEPLRNDDGEITLWIGTATDIHEIKILQQQRDDFISVASHELKTPITSLKTSLEILDLLKADKNPEVIEDLVSTSKKSVNKVAKLINDLLDASQLNKGQLTLNKEKFKLSSAIQECCKIYSFKGDYNIICKGKLDLQVIADEERICQVIINFVNNAIKYAPNSKEIVVDIEQLQDAAKISVIDKGPGIKTTELPQIFSRYYRVESKGLNYGGLGLGLYISNEIIKKHKGEIGVITKTGEGSTFWFTLPLNPAA